jgi:Ca-activated chloride channel family protein
MIFAEPLWLAALAALPLAALLFAWVARRDREALSRLVARPLWGRVVRRSAESGQWLRTGLLLAGAAGIVVALARPQWGIVRERVEREGVDVVLVLDTSGSMATADVAPSRFFLARQALLQLVSRLEGDRFALVAFEGEAYPLVPLTLDADAVGLFLDTVEPGIVPAPGTSVGTGLAKGLAAFVDEERRNKVMVLVSDGEDLEGDVEAAVRAAKEKGVVVHAVGVGTEAGQPVPELDADGRVTGYKRDASGNPVVSRLQMATLEEIARGTGGQVFRITPTDTSLSRLASAIEGLERKSLAQEWSYRRKERFQVPLGVGLACLAAGLMLPVPRLVRRRARTIPAAPAEAKARAGATRAAAVALAAGLVAAPAPAQTPSAPPPPDPAAATAPPASRPAADGAPATATRSSGHAVDEVLLRARRATAQGRGEYERGNHPQALQAFERAAGARPADPAVKFNLADGLYKNARYDEAAAIFGALREDRGLAAASRFNLGNSLYQRQDYKGAVQAYRDALRASPNDADTRRNLEMALRALKEQEEKQRKQQDQKQQDQKKQDQQKQRDEKDQKGKSEQDEKDQKGQPKKDPSQQGQDQQKEQRQPGQQGQPPPRPQTPQERADQRFREETGMPRERAMQLLDALQQNEKAEQKKALAVKRAQKKTGKDW